MTDQSPVKVALLGFSGSFNLECNDKLLLFRYEVLPSPVFKTLGTTASGSAFQLW